MGLCFPVIRKKVIPAYAVLAWMLLLFGSSDLTGNEYSLSKHSTLPVVELKIDNHCFTAELATGPAINQGLMFREQLDWDHGMLFVFDPPRRTAMWMKNTLIPLSVAFMDMEGIIMNIENMTPMTKDYHFSRGVAHYALEMNQGWFQEKGLRPGHRVRLAECMPR